MKIEGYELGGIVHMSALGPLWAATSSSGESVLISVYSSAFGESTLERWRAWSTITSPCVARLVDVVRHEDGRWALIQERVDGRPLDLLLGSDQLRPRGVREKIIEDLRCGVRALHAAGIVHGDLAPANIIVNGEKAVIVDLAVPVNEGEGSVGWSVSSHKTCESDWEALERIEKALETSAPSQERSSTAAAAKKGAVHELEADGLHRRKEGGLEDTREGIRSKKRAPQAAVLTTDEDAGSRLRVAAAREETMRIPVRHRRKIAPLGLLVLAAGVGLGVGLGMIVLSSSSPSTALSAESGLVCPSQEEAASALHRALEQRDHALESRDPLGLEEVIGGALLEQDRARIEAVKSSGMRFEALKTRIEVLADPSCDEGVVVVRVRLGEQSARVCEAEQCQELSGGEEFLFDLVASYPEWIWTQARAVEE
ncbi:hypothetical protein HMPREF9004_1345 [Schaalia cardiffensis F0333]|uniref:Protein kinase domain-containing protein n=1 Tax=Schaalia cardiffensis F0333 TaxID=888050 RepID=N6X2F3_9ACTO|nr:RIO1 family regulatory kinase/ATPase [Schaalia cardiffensis]ENO17941.1 hypothetical protein HMPREF9004_1345 [Schaalia cardiffensis F0333]